MIDNIIRDHLNNANIIDMGSSKKIINIYDSNIMINNTDNIDNNIMIVDINNMNDDII